jgi:hypothetical protein
LASWRLGGKFLFNNSFPPGRQDRWELIKLKTPDLLFLSTVGHLNRLRVIFKYAQALIFRATHPKTIISANTAFLFLC